MSDTLRPYLVAELGPDGYPFAWHNGDPPIKDLIRGQAGHRCIRCGHPYRKGEHGSGEWSPCDAHCTHGGPVRAFDSDFNRWAHGTRFLLSEQPQAHYRILTVHHLDGDKANCRWWNLLSLCQRCHLVIQGRVKPAQIYIFEHSEWFKPYAAGYYALTYLGQDLTREQTMERLDELLALERVS